MRIRDIILLLALTAIALFLRVQGNAFGLPYLYHCDEPVTINIAVKFGLGDLNPHYSFHPTLLHYIIFFMYGLFFLLGRVLGIFSNISDFQNLFFTNPTIFYLIARTISAVFGTMTVALVFFLGKKIFNKNIGFIAALFLTFTFLHMRSSHYARHDVAVTFFVVSAYFFLINIVRKGRLKDYLLGGFFSGLAIAANWNAIILVPSIVISNFFVKRSENKHLINLFFNKFLFLSGLMVVFGLFCGSPFLFLDFKNFLPGILHQVQRLLTASQSENVLTASMMISGWKFYVTHSLFYGLGWPLLILSIMGLFYSIYKRSSEDLILSSFPVIYYVFFGYMKRGAIDEYIIPVLPFLTLFAARLLWNVVISLKRRNIKLTNYVLLISIFLIILIPAKYTFWHNWLLQQPDTRTLAKIWIEDNIPKGSRIGLQDYVYVNPLSIPLVETREEKQKRLEAVVKIDPNKGKMLRYQLNFPYPEKTYELIEITNSFHMLKEFENYYDYDKLKSDKVEYVILRGFSNHPIFQADSFKKKKFIQDIVFHARLIKEFNPFKENSLVNKSKGRVSIYTPFDDVLERMNTGPWIKIYKVK